jgi:hypothetical protein
MKVIKEYVADSNSQADTRKEHEPVKEFILGRQ